MATRQEYADTIKAGATSLGTKLAMGALVAEFPIIANPILFAITEHFVDEVISKLILQTEFGLFFTYIDLRTTQQGRDLYAAIQARKALPKDASQETREAAEADQIRAFAKFAAWTS